jgi:dTDP-glucose pyrophosphorylase
MRASNSAEHVAGNNSRHIKLGGKIDTAIVLAAGDVPASLRPFVGRTCAAMLPVSGRPIVHWSLQHLHDHGVRRVIIGVKATELRMPRFLRQTFGSQMELLFAPVAEDLGPGFTLLTCLRQLQPNADALIVLGDTLFRFPEFIGEQMESFVLTAQVEDSDRWCLAEVSVEGFVQSFADKPKYNPGDWPALIGVYHLQDVSLARLALEDELSRGNEHLEMRHALLPYIEAGKLKSYPTASWFDCGNPDLLTSSGRRLLQARSFNSVKIDELRGTITKRSQHRPKFLSEINYYRQLPCDLATFFPRLVQHNLAPNDTFMTLEYYGYHTLSEVWVFEEYDVRYWKRIFETLARILECFAHYTVELSNSALSNFYWTKTTERLDAFARLRPEFADLVTAKEVRLNGRTLRGWVDIQPELEQRVRKLASRKEGQLIHGDLCFPNILFDPLSHLFKFIDPRGSFADSGIFGDARYDVAKLLHSIHGGYDFLIHDMFTVNRSGTDIQLQQFFPENRPAVLRAFEEVFSQSFDMGEVRLLEGLLFLSMCPLHDDNPLRQTAMFVTGLRIVNEVLSYEDMY